MFTQQSRAFRVFSSPPKSSQNKLLFQFRVCGPLLSCSAGVRHPGAPALARPLPPVVQEGQVILLMLRVNFSLTFLSVSLFLLSLSLSLPRGWMAAEVLGRRRQSDGRGDVK